MKKIITASAVIGAAVAAPIVFASTASASCGSFWGVGNGNGCTSVFGSAAFGLGNNATATASAPGSVAVGLGAGTVATAGSEYSFAVAAGAGAKATTGAGRLNIATALGNNAEAIASEGNGNFALAAGPATFAQAGYRNPAESAYSFNRAIAIGQSANATAVAGSRLSAVTIGALSGTEAGDATILTGNPNPVFSKNVKASTIGLGSTNRAVGTNVVSRVRGNGVTGGATN